MQGQFEEDLEWSFSLNLKSATTTITNEKHHPHDAINTFKCKLNNKILAQEMEENKGLAQTHKSNRSDLCLVRSENIIF